MTSPRHSALSLFPCQPKKSHPSVGDITPVEGVPASVKHELEEKAMNSFLNEMLGGEGNKEARERFRSLFEVSPPSSVANVLTC